MPDLIAPFRTLTDSLSRELTEAIEQAKLPGLGAGPSDVALTTLLNKDSSLFTGDDVTPGTRSRWMAGLWLLAGNLDRSHRISQDDESAAGSFWHGIMHRREGDFSNAKYWFRRVGRHAAMDQMAIDDPDRYPDPYVFVDKVELAVRAQDTAPELVSTQWIEWQRLMVSSKL